MSENEEPRVAVLASQVASLRAEVERLRRENRRWARMAGTDGLTGLPNKISFVRAYLPQALARASEEGQSIGMILIAADNLGEINEEFGREAGDAVIRQLASLIRARFLIDVAQLNKIQGRPFTVGEVLSEIAALAAKGEAA